MLKTGICLPKLLEFFWRTGSELRKIQGWTQTEFAGKSGMDYRYIGAIERGKVNITADNIEKIATGFGVKPYQLFLFAAEDKKKTEADI